MRFIYILILLCITLNTSKSKPYTDYILEVEARLNGNMYISDFNKVGNYKNCCPQYELAYGLAPALLFGAEIRNIFNLFGYDINYSIMLGYNDLSANYRVEQYIGNDLGTDSYQKIMVEHQLDFSYNIIANEHSLWFSPIKELPLDVKFAINFGIPLKYDFEQKEVLLSPEDATFPDGTKIFNPAKATLENANSFLYGIGLGARYLVTKFSDYELYANANLNFALNKMASDLNLNTHQASLGISLHYNIPKAEPPRPPTPPMPEAPLPPSPPISIKPEMDLITEFDYKKVNTGDTLNIIINKKEFINYSTVLPVLYYEKNSDKALKTNFVNNNSTIVYKDNIDIYDKINFSENYAKLIKEYIDKYPECKIKIISESEDEEKSLIEKRLDLVKKNLINSGIDKSLISSELLANNLKKDKNPLLTEESRKIYFDLSKGNGLLETKISSDSWIDDFNKVLTVIPRFKSEEPYKFEGHTTYNGTNDNKLKEGANQIVLASNMFIKKNKQLNVLEVESSIEDVDKNVAKAKAIFYLNSEEKLLKKYINLNKNQEKDEIEEFILGYMLFDKSDFYIINDFVLNYVRTKIKEGKTIEIIPLTDNIGTAEYNEILSQKRANSAIKLLDKDYNKYVVTYPKEDIFNNDSPYGRMMNRSVIIRVQ